MRIALVSVKNSARTPHLGPEARPIFSLRPKPHLGKAYRLRDAPVNLRAQASEELDRKGGWAGCNRALGPGRRGGPGFLDQEAEKSEVKDS